MTTVIDGDRVEYQDVGNGPAVIIAQTSSAESSFWQSQVKLLIEKGFRIVHCVFTEDMTEKAVIGLMNYLGLGRAVVIGLTANVELLDRIRRKFSYRIAATCLISPGNDHSSLSRMRCKAKGMPQHILIGERDQLGLQMIDHSLQSQSIQARDQGGHADQQECKMNCAEVSRHLLNFLCELHESRPRHQLWAVRRAPGSSVVSGCN